MSTFAPESTSTLLTVVALLAGVLAAGLLLSRLRPSTGLRALAWMITVAAFICVERTCVDAPPGFRMLAITGALLFAMKGVVSVESAAAGSRRPRSLEWIAFAAFWYGMRPALFSQARPGLKFGAALRRGFVFLALGIALIATARLLGGPIGPTDSASPLLVMRTLLIMFGMSFAVHFGVFNIDVGLLRLAGFPCRPLFLNPPASKSLVEFWSKRWNLAFSEMTALAIYRPLADLLGRRAASIVAFMFSGLMHELAISVPVKAGYGLPSAFFVLHAIAISLEARMARSGRPIAERGILAHVWVVSWLIIPAPLLFHVPFLRGVVWPLLG